LVRSLFSIFFSDPSWAPPEKNTIMNSQLRLFRATTLFLASGLVMLVTNVANGQGVASPTDSLPVYGTGTWDAGTLGNHRAIVHVPANTDAAWAHIAWRRRDKNPENKEIIVIDAATGKRVSNVARIAITQDAGDIVFQPVSGAGDYDIYFMPYKGNLKANYPKITYLEPTQTADGAWLSRNKLPNQLPNGAGDPSSAQAGLARFASATDIRFQSIDEFNRFTSMELVASQPEEAALLNGHPSSAFFVFPEDRAPSIRMTDALPAAWVLRGPERPIVATADQGEFYVFQLGLWAARRDLSDVEVAFTPLAGSGKAAIPSGALACFNFGGVDAHGEPLSLRVDVPQGKVQALWCGVQVPASVAPGKFSGSIGVSDSRGETKRIAFNLTVSARTLRNRGDDDPYRMSRLRWLNSRLALDDGVVAPYTPIQIADNRLSVLGRTIALAPNGLPASIDSAFSIEMTGLAKRPRPILATPIRLDITAEDGARIRLAGMHMSFVKRSSGIVRWEATGESSSLTETLQGELEFDGTLSFTVALTANKPVSLRDVDLHLLFAPGVAQYAMGLGYKGARAPERYDWRWDVQKNQDSAWIGDVNAGLQFSLRDNKYVRPLNTNFYHSQPLVMPASWDNHGKGGCHLASAPEKSYRVDCYSGARTMAAGETQYYNFRLMVTPFHSITPERQWKNRYFHAYKPLPEVAAAGADVINIHHATAINPFINYPFLRAPEMKSYVEDAHNLGMKLKIYYTVRELTNHAPEIFALDSLNGEVLAKGPEGGASWLQEHVPGSYLPGWHVPELDDSALVTTGMSRWLNFYVEGMRWLVENVHIDGLYLDDIAFDRTTMERIRKVLLRGNPGGLIDVHSANQYDERDGFASSANLYLEQFPFIDRLWFGEYFDYNSPPDYWLVEISGIPYGLMGEMLQGGGNPWRGMVYGMTGRLPWAGDPRPLWKFWDQYQIQKDRMIGYWVPSSPVTTGRKDILATTYLGNGGAIISLASWNKEVTDVHLKIAWKALGLKPSEATIFAPAIENFQPAREFKIEGGIPTEPGKGWLLVIEKKSAQATAQTTQAQPRMHS
jgi:hypothetical protein